MIPNHSFTTFHDDSTLQSLSHSLRRFSEKEILTSTGVEPIFDRIHFEKMAKLGLTAASIDERYTGTKLSTLEIATILFEISRAQLGPAIYLSVHQMVSKILSRSWSGELATLSIPKLADGSWLGAFCLTEASAGSDASSLKTRAEELSAGFKLTGEKIFITSAGLADLYLVFARTSEDKKNGISAFVVFKGDKGVLFGSHEKKMGCEGSPVGTVTFLDCIIPKERLVGTIGGGYKLALSALAGGRISIASCSCGIASRALELAVDYSKQRYQFNQPIGEFQGIQFLLADMYNRTKASILMTREAAISLDQDQSSNLLSSAAKCFATDAAMQTTTDAVQIFGGAGYMREYEVERLMRDAKMLQIVEGTNQIQRIIISKELYN